MPDPFGRPARTLPALASSRQARWIFAIFYVLCVAAADTADVPPLQPPHFVVEMRADAYAVAELFFDVGGGINAADSARVPVNASNEYGTVRFALPSRNITALRFDPLDVPGTVSVRRAFIEDSSGTLVHQVPLSYFIPLNQITARSDSGPEVTFSTLPNANDPMLLVSVPKVIDLSPLSWRNALRLSGVLLVCLVIAIMCTALFLMAWPGFGHVGPALDRLAAAVTDPMLVPVDRFAMTYYVGVVAFFVLSVSAGLHGSALSMYSMTSNVARGPVAPIIGIGKTIRGDEWAYHTPAILHQVYRLAPFDTERTPLGPDHTALFANLPVRHVTTLFRPQFWGFFVLPPAYGFSLYWQFKAFLLLTGVFSLLLVLTRSSKIAAFGALWYAFSPNIQWTYSWPSLLPEMVGLFCVVICAVLYMSVGRRPVLLAAAAIICAAGAVNFALCAYIPHQIPLVWLGVALCVWWLSVRWRDIFSREYALPRLAALSGAWLVVAVVLAGFYHDAQAALVTIANTSYPGRRSVPAGGYSALALFSHWFSFWESDTRIPLPQQFVNICECSGFFWLAPVTLFTLKGVSQEIGRRRAYWTLTVFGALFLLWMTMPVPQAIGRALFLDKTGGGRMIQVLGLVNIALVALSLSFTRESTRTGGRLPQTLALGGTVFAIVFPVLLLTNEALARFLTIRELLIAAFYASVLVLAVIQSRFLMLAACLLLPQILVFGLVNPVDRGLRVVESSPLFQFIQSRPELLRHRWIVYSYPESTFLGALGCDVVTGVKYVPDLRAFRVLDRAGAHQNLVNRGALVTAEPVYDQPAAFELVPPNILRVRINPLDSALREIGVRYAAFKDAPPPEVAARMRPLATSRVGGLWLYELP